MVELRIFEYGGTTFRTFGKTCFKCWRLLCWNNRMGLKTRNSGLFPCYRLKINDFLSSYNQNLKINIFTPLQQIPCYCKGRLGTLRLISWWWVTTRMFTHENNTIHDTLVCEKIHIFCLLHIFSSISMVCVDQSQRFWVKWCLIRITVCTVSLGYYVGMGLPLPSEEQVKQLVKAFPETVMPFCLKWKRKKPELWWR